MFKKILLTLLSVLFLFVLIYGFVHFYSKYLIGFQNVYVTSHNLSQRSFIKEEDLKEISVPKDYLSEEIYINKEDIINKYVKLGYSIPKASFFYKSALDSDIKDLAHTLLKEGEVNYDLYVDDIKINTANLAVNMYFDIYLTLKIDNKLISDLLISDVRITGIYDYNNETIYDYQNNKIKIITVAIKNEQVLLLNKALLLGEVSVLVKANSYDLRQNSITYEESKVLDYLV